MSENIRQQVDLLCDALYNHKAFDILAIPVGDKTIIADWFIVCSGRVPSQIRALCDDLEEKAAEAGLELRRKEGYTVGRWIVLDYSDVLVHIFHPEERQYYNVEHLWDTDGAAIHYSTERDAAEAAARAAAMQQD